MTKRKDTCRMDGCTHDADGSVGLCKPCYAFMHYWKRKSPAQILGRIDNLERAERRMGTIVPRKVSRIKRKRRA